MRCGQASLIFFQILTKDINEYNQRVYLELERQIEDFKNVSIYNVNTSRVYSDKDNLIDRIECFSNCFNNQETSTDCGC